MVSDSRGSLIHGVAGCRLSKSHPRSTVFLRFAVAAALSTILASPPGARAQASAVTLADRGKPVRISDGARAAADAMFGDRCAVCHGPEGDGQGPGAANLNPKPIDFHNRKWQRSITDAAIAKAIVYGGPAVGLSPSMAANPDLETQPDVVAALIERIRGLGGNR